MKVSLSASPGCSFKQVKCCKGWASVSPTSYLSVFSLTETAEATTSRVIQLHCITSSLIIFSEENKSFILQITICLCRTFCHTCSIYFVWQSTDVLLGSYFKSTHFFVSFFIHHAGDILSISVFPTWFPASTWKYFYCVTLLKRT